MQHLLDSRAVWSASDCTSCLQQKFCLLGIGACHGLHVASKTVQSLVRKCRVKDMALVRKLRHDQIGSA